MAAAVLAYWTVSLGGLAAQEAQRAAGGLVPSSWDPQRRYERPVMAGPLTIRFLTESDYPPFNYMGQGEVLTGFNIDLARLLCEELGASCTVQMRRFDTLIDSLSARAGDAVIASVTTNADTRGRADFTDAYYRTPARFVARKGRAAAALEPTKGTPIAVVAGTSHEAFGRVFFTDTQLVALPNDAEARAALAGGVADLLFGDAIQLALWLNSADSGDCCEFRAAPFPDSRYFGEGIGIAVRRGDDALRNALNWALFKSWENGRYAELWLRYFPISPY